MSGSAAALAPAAGPTVYVDVDGSTGYQKALACDALMVFSDLLEALAESRVFKSYFDGVNLSLCRVYFMGQEEPAPNTTTGGTLLSGKRTALASMPEVGFDVYIRIDTTAARLTTAAAGACSPPCPAPDHVVLHGSVQSRGFCPRAARPLGIRCCLNRASSVVLLGFPAAGAGGRAASGASAVLCPAVTRSVATRAP
jgi:hypothetical protein